MPRSTMAAMANIQFSTKIAGPRKVQCPGCGASNTILSGGLGECEYCGSTLV